VCRSPQNSRPEFKSLNLTIAINMNKDTFECTRSSQIGRTEALLPIITN
jgi:hypothetical protein